MIRVVLSDDFPWEAEAVLRSVSSDLAADTAFSRDMELKAGPDVSQRLQAMGELPIGAAVITPGGDHPARFLIHAVLQSSEEPVRAVGVSSALQNGLRRAQEWGLESLALPPLGTGAGNLEAEESASVMIPLITSHLQDSECPKEITIVAATDYEVDVFLRAVDLA
jgi:O-acetyl-ADP-ribose deacetylase (regulator of RNase III)